MLNIVKKCMRKKDEILVINIFHQLISLIKFSKKEESLDFILKSEWVQTIISTKGGNEKNYWLAGKNYYYYNKINN